MLQICQLSNYILLEQLRSLESRDFVPRTFDNSLIFPPSWEIRVFEAFSEDFPDCNLKFTARRQEAYIRRKLVRNKIVRKKVLTESFRLQATFLTIRRDTAQP